MQLITNVPVVQHSGLRLNGAQLKRTRAAMCPHSSTSWARFRGFLRGMAAGAP